MLMHIFKLLVRDTPNEAVMMGSCASLWISFCLLMRFLDVLNYTKSEFHWESQLQKVSSPLLIAL